MVPRGCLRFVIVVFPDHTHLLFLIRVYLLDFFCSGVQFYLMLSLIFALSPCYMLIYMF